MSFDVVNIYDFISVGEALFEQVAKTFSSINNDIECFLKSNALEFAKRKQAVTYLVFKEKILVGYFTIAVKTFEIKESYIENDMQKVAEGLPA